MLTVYLFFSKTPNITDNFFSSSIFYYYFATRTVVKLAKMSQSFFKPKRRPWGSRNVSSVRSPFPIFNDDGSRTTCLGTFNGFGVEVSDLKSMLILHDKGYFGKGNLSRSKPAMNKNPLSTTEQQEIQENLHLSLEESFFLSYALGVLIVEVDRKPLNLDEMWNLFCQTSCAFVSRYAVYHHFRSEGWTVKSGLKFGSDFLLYKIGPESYHASYSVQVMQGGKPDVNFDWIKFAGMDRTTEAAAKELLFCYVYIPDDVSSFSNSPKLLELVTLKKIAWKRWVAAQKRDTDTIS